jgi:hypothetical protein
MNQKSAVATRPGIATKYSVPGNNPRPILTIVEKRMATERDLNHVLRDNWPPGLASNSEK